MGEPKPLSAEEIAHLRHMALTLTMCLSDDVLRLLAMLDAVTEERDTLQNIAEVAHTLLQGRVTADGTPLPTEDGDKMPPALALICNLLANTLEDTGAPNYAGWEWERGDGPFYVVVGRVKGETPMAQAARWRRRAELAEARLAAEQGKPWDGLPDGWSWDGRCWSSPSRIMPRGVGARAHSASVGSGWYWACYDNATEGEPTSAYDAIMAAEAALAAAGGGE